MAGSNGHESTDERVGSVELERRKTRNANALLRFAVASLGSAPDAVALIEEIYARETEPSSDESESRTRVRFFGAARKRAAQLLEQRRRGDGSRVEPSPLSALPLEDVRPTEREALLLRYVGGLSSSDAAAAAGVDEATLRARLSRGLAFICRLTSEPVDIADATLALAANRRAVEEALADVIDGLAPDAVADFVATDDPSRDLVHDAGRVAEKLRSFAPVGVTLSPRVEPPPTENVAPPVKTASPAEATKSEEATTKPAETTTKPAETTTKPAETTTKPAEATTKPAGVEGGARRRRIAIAAGVATALGVFGVIAGRSHGGASYADEAWSGKLTSVSRAFGGGVGVERCSPDRAVCSRVDEGDDVPQGSTLRTDGQTRAVVEMRDGTRIVLDRGSELLLDGTYARRARLEHGNVVADVPAVGASRARFDVPLGFLETESTKVSLTVDTASNEAEVARGAVRLADANERSVAVHAGELGRLEPLRTPAVFPSASMGERFGWTERAFAKVEAPEETIRGLGELGAKKPGEEHEKKGLVSLTSHSTRIRIVGNVARTEIEEEFTSTSDDVLEGVFRFPLPPDAQLERLALDVDGKVEEGAFVDRDRASAIWRGAIVNAGAKKPAGEEIVWVPGPWRDPALLEWQRGGRFELRIYPIPKRASRKVLLAYTQVIAPSGGVRRYIYPLPYDPAGSTRIGRFDVDVEVRGNDANAGVTARGYELRQQSLPDGVRQLSYTAQGFTPTGDLAIEYSLPNAGQEVTAWAYRPSPDETAKPTGAPGASGEDAYVAIALDPKLPRSQDGLERDFAVIVDASRSMFGERYRRASSLAERVVREMDRGDRVTVLACDSTCRELPSGLSSAGPATASAVGDFLRGVTPEGGSDIGGAVTRAREALRDAAHGAARIVYIGDGTPTIGPVGPSFIRREIESSVPRDVGTVTSVAIGADADLGTLTTLADAGGGVLVPYVPGQTLLDTAFALLGATYGTTLSDVSVDLPQGLTDVAPQRVGTLRAGGETMFVARMSAPSVSGTLTLRGRIGGAPFEQHYPLRVDATTAKGNAFVPRLWAAGKLSELEQRPDVESRRSAVELSGRFHVASRYTSLLVLESAAMMHAFGLERDDHAASWTGDSASESTVAEGEDAVVEADDGRGGLADKAPLERPESNAASPGAVPSPSPARRSRALAEAADGYAQPSSAPAKASKEESEEKANAYTFADDLDGPSKKHGYAPPPSAAPTGTSGRLGTSGGGGYALAPKDEMAGPPLMQSPFEPIAPHFGRRYVPMRKIWERIGHIVTPATVPGSVSDAAVATAEREASSPDPSRESMKRLYTLYSLGGHIEQASDVAERWSAKDPLDPDALTARADVAAARGERDAAIRILGSVVDVRPGDQKAVFRLARLFRWAGSPDLSCRYSMAAAEIRSTDSNLLSEAVRCTRDLGRADVASDLISLAGEPVRREADALLAAKAVDPSVLTGDLRLEATWAGGDDLDLALLPPDGARISWLGAPSRAVISARDVRSTTREGLALRGGAPGDYLVEVTRPAGHRGSVLGSLVVFAAGDRRVVPFKLDGTSTRVALLKITTRPRLVPL